MQVRLTVNLNKRAQLKLLLYSITKTANKSCSLEALAQGVTSELTKQALGTTSLPNVCKTASFTLWITSTMVFTVFSTPFLSPTKTQVHWVSRVNIINKVSAREKD